MPARNASSPRPRDSHLKLRRGRWNFRMRVPKDQLGKGLGTEITKDLRTANRRDAERLARQFERDLQGIFSALRAGAVLGTPKGGRPLPSTYLSPDYINKQLTLFDGGATRFMSKANYQKYGPGQVDGTSFVMPTSEVNRLMKSTHGDPVLDRLDQLGRQLTGIEAELARRGASSSSDPA